MWHCTTLLCQKNKIYRGFFSTASMGFGFPAWTSWRYCSPSHSYHCSLHQGCGEGAEFPPHCANVPLKCDLSHRSHSKRFSRETISATHPGIQKRVVRSQDRGGESHSWERDFLIVYLIFLGHIPHLILTTWDRRKWLLFLVFHEGIFSCLLLNFFLHYCSFTKCVGTPQPESSLP